jgi:hypothetical protein
MLITKYRCGNCNKEHEKKVYATQSEGVADIFTEQFFPSLWEVMKEKSQKQPLDQFCKELVLTAIYHYHKNRRRIHVAKDSIEHSDRIESPTH